MKKGIIRGQDPHHFSNSILDAIHDVILILDPSGKILSLNNSSNLVLKYEKNELIGQSISSILFNKENISVLSQIVQGREIEDVYIDLRSKKKDEIPALLTGSVIQNNRGLITYIVLVFKDLRKSKMVEDIKKNLETRVQKSNSELSDINRKLEREKVSALKASHAKGVFLANMSHEIRTPLNSIIGMADILKEASLPDEYRNYLTVLSQSTENLLGLVNNIIDITKIESGEIIVERKNTDLKSLIADSCKMLSIGAKQKGIDLYYKIDPDVPKWIVTDPVKLKQIVTNLISNSCKFTESGHVAVILTLEEKKQTSYINVSIEDTGIGIPVNKQKDVFQEFTQVDASTTRKYGGSGLGLSIVRSLTTLLGGDIKLTSSLNKGSIFRVSIPLDRGERGEAHSQDILSHDINSAQEKIGKYKLLIVENDRGLFETIMEVLSSLEVEINRAESACEGLKILAKKDFDTILSDYNLPKMTGLELKAELNKRHNNTPFILMTGMGDTEIIKDTFKNGGVDFIEKPFNIEKLKKSVKSTLQTGYKLRDLQERRRLEIALPSARILIAEDSKENQFLLKVFLKKTLCSYEFAENGEIAFNLYKTESWDLIFMDLQMPVMDGHESMKAIRKYEVANSLKRTPIVVLTAHALKKELDEAIKSGADFYLTKPVKKSDFLQAIADYSQEA